MFSAHSRDPSRRRFLAAGGLTLGGFGLSALWPASASAQSAESLTTGKSVIVLFQQGGPSQHETFDPKPDVPDGVRTVTGTIKTKLPGILFGDSLPQLADRADRLTVVRSFATNNGGHNVRPLVGPETADASIGALYASIAGATHPTTAVPSSAVLFPQSVDDDVTAGKARGDLAATGDFGGAFAPFQPGGRGQLMKNLRLTLEPDRFADRRALLAGFDTIRRGLDADAASADFDADRRQALDVLVSGSVVDALDLSREDPKLLAAYDTSRYAAKDGWKKSGRGKRGYYTGHAKTLGKSLLLARRLCEAGSRFVTVHSAYDGVWDMHGDGNNLGMVEGMEAVGRSFDHAVAAFIDDLERRGLSDKVLLVCTGEMGRTPKINKRGGRDHWSRLAPMMTYGGGSERGRVVGQSTRDGGEPAQAAVDGSNLVSTILHTLFDVPQLRLRPEFAAISRLAELGPIPGTV